MSAYIRSQARSRAVETALSRQSRYFKGQRDSKGAPNRVSDYFGCNTFSLSLMETKLPREDVNILRLYAKTRATPLSPELANRVALAVKEWALSKGATHYCHWFQPYTGATAEKHDSFFLFSPDGSGIETFTGKQLVQSEPDASSFPSGGARATFEARGYTGWDASSPMFLMETENGLTLCIPSVFISYSGEALDKKVPLLRSISAINDKARETLHLLGHHHVKWVTPTCGAEQEYFIIDKAFYNLRPDLMLAKRTLMGGSPPKGQQLEDHYFGSINARVLSFMMEVEHELFKLGVPIKTRHNEVAPAQYEAAPTYEYANVAADHNQLTMEVLRSVARRHDLVVLFHEKPFAEINGSGKHVNWSLEDSQGHNLLEPGDNPETNLRFLYFLGACLKAIADNAELLRCAIASAGNDFRLGANEAPPAIISAFLGETLTRVLDKLEGKDLDLNFKRFIDLDIANVPLIARDATDRNRTSPFAFTGNKFEFRALGASASISPSLMYLNATIAQALGEMNTRLKEVAGGASPSDDNVLQVIRETFKASRKVCFEGNNYSEEWHREAEKRGLPNHRTTPQAIKILKNPRVKAFMSALGVLTDTELDLRHNILVERYIKMRLIELETMRELITTHVLPTAYAQLENLKQTRDQLSALAADGTAEIETESRVIGRLIKELMVAKTNISALVKASKEDADHDKTATRLAEEGMRLQQEARKSCDELESLCDDFLWSLPKYREMLYII